MACSDGYLQTECWGLGWYGAVGTYGLSVGGPGRHVAVGTYRLSVGGLGWYGAVGTYGLSIGGPGWHVAVGTYGLSVGGPRIAYGLRVQGPGRYVALGTYELSVGGPGRHVAVGAGLLPGPVVEVGRRVVVEQHAGAVLVHVRRPVHDLTLVFVILRIPDPRLIHQQLQVRNL